MEDILDFIADAWNDPWFIFFAPFSLVIVVGILYFALHAGSAHQSSDPSPTVTVTAHP